MKNLFLLLVIILTGCNNVISEEGENENRDTLKNDTISNNRKLNDVINQNNESGDSVKNIENIEQQLKDNPE